MERNFTTHWCNHCRCVAQCEIRYTEYIHPGDGDLPDQVFFATCVTCSSPSVFRGSPTNIDEWHMEQVFPKPMRKSLPDGLPARVQESYQEALRCWSADAVLATAVMVRRTLEAIAREFDPTVKSPAKGIDVLSKAGLISPELAEWGHALRFLGNIGAHPTEHVVKPEDAGDSLDFLDAIVETIYRLRPKFQAMKARRAQGQLPPAGAPPLALPPAEKDSGEEDDA